MRKKFLFVGLLLAFGVAASSDGGLGAKLKALEKRLEAVKVERMNAEKFAKKKTEEYNRFQHDVVYQNPKISKVYNEMKALEKQLVEKREELSVLTMKLPEMRKILKERKEAYERLRNVRESERLLGNEIEALKLQAAEGKSK